MSRYIDSSEPVRGPSTDNFVIILFYFFNKNYFIYSGS